MNIHLQGHLFHGTQLLHCYSLECHASITTISCKILKSNNKNKNECVLVLLRHDAVENWIYAFSKL